jgi:hypothetical protein
VELHYSVISNNKYTKERNKTMAKNGKTNDRHLEDTIKQRSQTFNPSTERWVKRDTETGRFMGQKSDNKPFKGVREENK